MSKKIFALAALAIVVGAAFFISCAGTSERKGSASFVRTRGTQFVINGRPFRFVGANIAVMYRDEDRAQMPELLARASQSGIRVVRVWASGEGGPNDLGPLADFADWPRNHPFRWAPGQWNEEAFVHLDKVIAEASRNNVLVQLCLVNWWRDTGGVTQYLRWAGVNDAAKDDLPFGIDPHRAMEFYTNAETRRLYREHIEKLVTRRNTITGTLYRDDPNIFGWELINEGQAMTGRWAERRAWIAEMSSLIKSLDPNHVVTPGTWGYRTAAERREWLLDHQLPTIDYCDVHNYPRPDTNSFVDSPTAMREFVDNRAAAAFSIKKPLVFGEFGMGPEGFNGFSQTEWFRAFFESNVRAGAAGSMFWILTPDPGRGYGVTYTARDEGVIAEVSRASQMFASLSSAEPPERLTDGRHHLIPRQFSWTRDEGDPSTRPQSYLREDKSILYRFKPRMAVRHRFEKLGSGIGYIWGFGMGQLDYLVPEREDRRRISQVIVRAFMQPIPPDDAKPENIQTRVTLFINGVDCGSRLVSFHKPGTQPVIQEWVVDKYWVRIRAMRGLPMTIRFAVTTDADWAYGVNISNWPEGYEAGETKPLEVEIRR